MFTAFDLKCHDDFSEYYELGMEMFSEERKRVQQTLDKYLIDNEVIDGTALRNDWFPQVPADVFLSHSHLDEEMAIGLAGYLKHHLKLNVFIDSCVWGYANDLQHDVDVAHVTRTRNDHGGYTYNYDERNYSTSHVHMMLASALKAMIDKTECVFFLNSSKSISSITSRDVIRHGTMSPWIYFELDTMSTIRRRLPKHHRLGKSLAKGQHVFTEDTKQKLLVFYDVNMDNLLPMKQGDLDRWKNKHRYSDKTHSLDDLYELMKINVDPMIPLLG